MVPPCSGRIARVPPYSSLVIDFAFRVRGYPPLWPDFPDRSTKLHRLVPTGLFRFRSPLLTESRLISFPPGTEMFQFPGLASSGLCIHPPITPSACTVTLGCPIRTSPDQGPFDGSPELFAAYHVLLRLSTPRH